MLISELIAECERIKSLYGDVRIYEVNSIKEIKINLSPNYPHKKIVAGVSWDMDYYDRKEEVEP